MTQLFTDQDEDADSGVFASSGTFVTLLLAGDFDAGTVTVQASPDSTTWLDTDVVISAPGVRNFVTGRGVKYRLHFAGSTSPNLNAWVAYEQ